MQSGAITKGTAISIGGLYGTVTEEFRGRPDELVAYPTLGDERVRRVARADVRVRELVSIVQVLVSDTPHHDTHFVRRALQMIWQWLVCTNYQQADRWTDVHVRSDGTSQHFKSKGTLSSLLEFKQAFGLRRVTWCFRAPYHGKGPWDGIAAVVKRQLRARLLKDESLIVNTSSDVFKLLREIFAGTFKRRTVHAFNIMELTEQMIERVPIDVPRIQMEDHVSSEVRGVRKLFSFSAGNDGEFYG